MKTIGKLIIFIFTILTLAVSAYAAEAELQNSSDGDDDNFVRQSYSLFVDCVANAVVDKITAQSEDSATIITDRAFESCNDYGLLYKTNLQVYFNDKYDPQKFSTTAMEEAEKIFQRKIQAFRQNIIVVAIPKLRAGRTK